uniref:Uncharacterized protein n=1 Tax=Romanomermis culicivorax TaxID=13658 RepID=A0A915KS61_ROMCU
MLQIWKIMLKIKKSAKNPRQIKSLRKDQHKKKKKIKKGKEKITPIEAKTFCPALQRPRMSNSTPFTVITTR